MDILIRFPIVKTFEIFFNNLTSPEEENSNLNYGLSWIPTALISCWGILLLLIILSLPQKKLRSVYKWYFLYNSMLDCSLIHQQQQQQENDSSQLQLYQLLYYIRFISNYAALFLTNTDRSKVIEGNLIFYFLLLLINNNAAPEDTFLTLLTDVSYYVLCVNVLRGLTQFNDWFRSLFVAIEEMNFCHYIRANSRIKLILKVYISYWFIHLICGCSFPSNFIEALVDYEWSNNSSAIHFKEWIVEIFNFDGWNHEVKEWNYYPSINELMERAFNGPSKVFGAFSFLCFLTHYPFKYILEYLSLINDDKALSLAVATTAFVFSMAVDERIWNLSPHQLRQLLPIYFLLHSSCFLSKMHPMLKSACTLKNPSIGRRKNRILKKRQFSRIFHAALGTFLTSIFLLTYFWAISPISTLLIFISIKLIRANVLLIITFLQHANNHVEPYKRNQHRRYNYVCLDVIEAHLELITTTMFISVFIYSVATWHSNWLLAIRVAIDVEKLIIGPVERKVYYDRLVIVKLKSDILSVPDEKRFAAHDDVCPICHADMDSAITCRQLSQCQHLFHSSCVMELLRWSNKCPVCTRRLYNDTKFVSVGNYLAYLRSLKNEIPVAIN